MKYPEGNRVFTGCESGYLSEYLINEGRIAHDFGKILPMAISSMATTFDNKYLFVCCSQGGFTEFDLSTYKEVNNFGVDDALYCLVTYDNKFLITTRGRNNAKLTKHSLQIKQQYHTWDSDVNEYVMS